MIFQLGPVVRLTQIQTSTLRTPAFILAVNTRPRDHASSNQIVLNVFVVYELTSHQVGFTLQFDHVVFVC